jgi:hypothetical protein
MEKVFQKLSLSEMEQVESRTNFPKRPQPGKSGKGIQLYANYIEVSSLPVGELVQYDVSIRPESMRATNRRIFDAVDASYRRSAFDGKLVAYDGMSSLYSYGPLPKNQFSLEAEIDGKNGREPKKYVMNIKKVSSVNLASLQSFLQGKLDYTPYEVINALEVILRNPLISKGIIVGRSIYSSNGPTRPREISGGLEVWSGYFHSLRPSLGRMLLNIDINNTAFFRPGSLIAILKEICRGQIPSSLDGHQYNALDRLIKGMKVEVTHRGANFSKKFKVWGLDRSADQIRFNDQEGAETNVLEYFVSKYGIRLEYPRLPCLVVGSPDKKSFLPIEVCRVPNGQHYVRKLNEMQTSDMIKIANSKPSDRFSMIKNGIPFLKENSNYYQNFKVSFGNELVKVQGRVLQPPVIHYGSNSQEPSIQPFLGAWNMKGKRVETGAVVKSWSVLVVSNRINTNEVQNFIEELVRTCIDTGMVFEAKNPPIIVSTPNLEDSLRNAAKSADQKFHARAQFILVVLPTTESAVYGQIKRVGDTELGIPTQCMQAKHTRTPNKQYCANLSLKINLKLGGTNLTLGNQLLLINEQPTIVFGADVTHPGIGEDGKPSIAAVVASMDRAVSRYAANVRVQGSRQEIIDDLKSMVKEHLQNFRVSTGFIPTRIIFYRDGVGEGQFAQVTQSEVKAIKDACHELSPTYNPALIFTLVQKRHHTRFLCVNPSDADRSGNVPAGTVVDTPTLINPSLWEFYLCSHAGLQGSSRPARYVVVHDDLKLNNDDLQVFTHALCHTFARCTRSVSIATPAYYAHLVAFRARFHFLPNVSQSSKTFSQVKQDLSKQMYFI